MIKFFRRIRQKLLSENKFSKYLLYAIGEIVLVVIGILIALQINNWNSNKESKSEMIKIYVSIIDELENDRKKLDEILPEFQWKTDVMRRIITEDISLQEWKDNDSLFNSFNSFPDFQISQERFKLFQTKVPPNETTRVINNKIIDFYTKHNTDITIRTTEANMSYHRNIEYWEENEAWFTTAIVNRDFQLLGEYARKDTSFKNKIVWYRIMLSRLKGGLKSYSDESKHLIKEINTTIEKIKN